MHSLAVTLALIGAIALLAGVLISFIKSPTYITTKIGNFVYIYLGLIVICIVIPAFILAKEADEKEPVWVDNAYEWKAIPLTVKLQNIEPAYKAPIEAAMHDWGMLVGCPLFIKAQDTTTPNIVIDSEGIPCNNFFSHQLEKNENAGTWVCGDNTANIEVPDLGDIQQAYKITMHELGHVLGLAHDPTGLMAPNITNLTLFRPSDKDIKAIKYRYCK